MNKPALTFRVYQGSSLVRRETVQQDIVKIGKDPKSHVRVDCDLASRMHAVLEANGADQLTLIDLGNEPGTLVNGRRINKCSLRAGDRIQIGTTTLELESVEDRPSTAPAALPVAALFAPLHNPFLAPMVPIPPSPVLAVEQPAHDGDFVMLRSAPAVNLEEVEQADVTAIEVLVKWDSSVLHVAHLSPVRSFFVGERDEKGGACDYLLPTDVLGASRMPIVVSRAATAWLIVPRGAAGTVAMPNEESQSIDDYVAAGRARPSTEVSGAYEIELLSGTRARMTLERSQIVFEVSAVNAGKKVPVGFLAGLESSAYKHVGVSVFAHLGIVASLAFFMPKMSPDEAEGIDRDYMAHMLHAADANQLQELEKVEEESNQNDQSSGGDGKRAENAEGQMGNQLSREANRRYSMAGPPDSDPKVARERALEEARNWGAIGMLAQDRGALNVPTAAWGEDNPVGRDAKNFLGQMWGPEAGDAWGIAGLGLSGNEEGGGGLFRGIGLDRVGTAGHGGGCIDMPGKPCGIGFGPGGEGIGHGYKPGGNHVPTARPPREGTPEINGRLRPEVIRRIVHQNFGRFRNCYESSLRTNPSLQGRVAVKFVIGRDGSVTLASDAGSDLPDQGVIRCVTRSFANLSFPQPEGGIVTVVYPLVFTPAD